MQPILNASKAWQTIPWFFKKREPTKKHKKNKLSLGKEVDEPKTSSLVKNVKQFHSEILKLKI